MNALIQVWVELERMPLFIDDTGGLAIAQVAGRARRLKRSGDLGLIVVDYLQLLAGSGSKRNENRVQEVTEITKGLKTLAKELAVPIIALSQLSRGVDNRDDKRPVLADLRESGSIEQDADQVMFVYREAYYLETKAALGHQPRIRRTFGQDGTHQPPRRHPGRKKPPRPDGQNRSGASKNNTRASPT